LSPPQDAQDFFRISCQFADRSGLMTPEVREVIRVCQEEQVPASMTMLGNGVFAYGRKARAALRQFGEVYEFTMAKTGTRIVGENL
jgi:pantoate kinase